MGAIEQFPRTKIKLEALMHVSGNRPGFSKVRQSCVSLVINYRRNLVNNEGRNSYKKLMNEWK